MLRKIMITAAVGALCAAATPAEAASTTQPGETVGLAVAKALPPGVYFLDTSSWGERQAIDAINDDLFVSVPVLVWATPRRILGGQVQFLLATPFIHNPLLPEDDRWGAYNVWGAAELVWDLGNDWGFRYLAGGYTDRPSDVGIPSASFNQRFGLGYYGDNWNLTANVIHGVQLDSDVADFVNVDLTATKKFGPWEIGLVAFGSTDLEGDDPLSQIAVGGLIGYSFDRFSFQVYGTTEVMENHYNDLETRIWGRVIWTICKDEPIVPPLK
jgi:hypothetical protein